MLLRTLFLGLSLVFLTVPLPIFAVDLDDMAARIARMERRITTMEDKLFNTNSALNTNGTTMMSDFELRLQEIEKESSTLYGSVEDLGNAVETLAISVKKMNEELVFRLQDLEKSLDGTSKRGVFAKKKLEPTEEALPPVIEKPEKFKIPENISKEKLYGGAYKALTRANYEKSLRWFEVFIERYPKDALAENAHYWIGEIYMVENKPEKAVLAFKQGMQAFPKGEKQPAFLLKIGESLVSMGNYLHANSVFQKLVKEFPKTVESSKARTLLKELEAVKKEAIKKEEKPAKDLVDKEE